MIELSVAICTYNNATLLDRTLAALEKQQVNPSFGWSVLVVDNKSSDNTQLVVEQYIERGLIPRLKYVRENQQGLGFARRRAVIETNTDLVAFVDDDCLVDCNWVQNACMFAQAHPQAGAIGGKVQLEWSNSPGTFVWNHAEAFTRQNYGDIPKLLKVRDGEYLAGAGLVLRRTALLASGYLHQMVLVDRKGRNLSSGGDIELDLGIFRSGYELWYNPAMSLNHYIKEQRMSVSYLTRLARSNGRTHPFLKALVENQSPHFLHRMRLLISCIRGLLKLAGVILIAHVRERRYITPEQKLAAQFSIGLLEGRLYALWHRPVLSNARDIGEGAI